MATFYFSIWSRCATDYFTTFYLAWSFKNALSSDPSHLSNFIIFFFISDVVTALGQEHVLEPVEGQTADRREHSAAHHDGLFGWSALGHDGRRCCELIKLLPK